MNEENNVNQQTTNTQTLNQVNAEQSSQQAINSIPEQEVTVNNPVTVSSGQQYNVLKFENIESGKPPVAAQILYAFGILGLIFGLLMSVLAFASSNETSSFSSFFGLSSLDI